MADLAVIVLSAVALAGWVALPWLFARIEEALAGLERHDTRVEIVDVTVNRFRPSCSCGWVGDRSRMTDAYRAADDHYYATLIEEADRG